MLRRWLEPLHREDDGQDLIEYTLLIAFLALASVGIFMQVGTSGAAVWSGANTTIEGAATTASGTSANTTAPPNGGSGGGGSSGGDGHHDGRH
jgi:Flp pilus assembly pilin Flp